MNIIESITNTIRKHVNTNIHNIKQSVNKKDIINHLLPDSQYASDALSSGPIGATALSTYYAAHPHINRMSASHLKKMHSLIKTIKK